MELKFILQGLTSDCHFIDVNNLLAITAQQDANLMISVAFMTKGGLNLLNKEHLERISKKQLYVGINNKITTKQAIKTALELGFNIIAIDTASTTNVFHTKIYVSYTNHAVSMILGSANLTSGGLRTNIESSSYMTFNSTDQGTFESFTDMLSIFVSIQENFPNNTFSINCLQDIESLDCKEMLENEEGREYQETKNTPNHSSLTQTPKIKLNLHPPLVIKKETFERIDTPKVLFKGNNLVWESKELTRRDIGIPTNQNTHVTGSLLLKKGSLVDIDQRHYFREVIFSGLNWVKATPPKSHLERATVHILIICNGEEQGEFNLELTHNTDTLSKTYQQNNGMTSLKWGVAKTIVAKEIYLGKKLYLYGTKKQDSFILSIK